MLIISFDSQVDWGKDQNVATDTDDIESNIVYFVESSKRVKYNVDEYSNTFITRLGNTNTHTFGIMGHVRCGTRIQIPSWVIRIGNGAGSEGLDMVCWRRLCFRKIEKSPTLSQVALFVTGQ